jgi:glycosyltransferase involved in cell wall biosynthesis
MPDATPPPPDARPLLTLAIPTYNRASNLALLLDHLGPQLAELPQVELLISDNASSDATEATVQRYISQGLRCRYIRNPENLDSDPNFLQCYEQATGRYVWIFGDDDVLFPGALAYILPHLSGQPVDIAFVAAFHFDHAPNETGLANPQPEIYTYTAPKAFLHAVGLRNDSDLILISSVIVNKDTIEHEPHPDFTVGYRTQLLQLGWTFTAIKRMRRAVIFDRGLLAVCGLDPKRMFDSARVFGVNWELMVRTFIGRNHPLYTTLLNQQLYSWFVTRWYGIRRHPDLTIIRDPVGQMKPIYGHLALFWVCAYPLLAWPMFPAGCWLALWRTIRRVDRLLHRRRYGMAAVS